MDLCPIQHVIPESQIVIFAPHYDDVLLGLGNYILELTASGRLAEKTFQIFLVFSRSNYQAGSGAGNADASLERVKLATGNRLIEDLECLDELLGAHQYRYALQRERECLLRAKRLADSEMEFPHGMYADFDAEDWQILARVQALAEARACEADTALVFPLAIKEHIDHFIVREAGLAAARKLGQQARARFYFQEDKPYAGIQTDAEEARIAQWVQANDLHPRLYRGHPTALADLAFKHYVSQVEPVYREGICRRSEQLQRQYQVAGDCDCLFAL